MRTPFGYIETDGRRRIDQLGDVELAQTRRMGETLGAIARSFRGARTIGDVLDVETQMRKAFAGAEDDEPASTPAPPIELTGAQKREAYDAALARAQPQGLSPAAALYGFMGWLTSRDTPSGPFSGSHGAAEAAELVDAFCRSQGLDVPPDGWQNVLKPYPTDVRAIGFDEALNELHAAGEIEARHSDVEQHDEVIEPTGGAAVLDPHGNEPPATAGGAT